MLERWLNVFGSDRVFVGLYDEVSSDPDKLLEKICHLLGLPQPVVGQTIKDVIFPGVQATMSPELEDSLHRYYAGDIRRLAGILNKPEITDL